MAVEFTRGDILNTDADYLVIPVNCVGKPGKGLAQQWAQNAPTEMLQWYIRTCARGDFHPGQILHWEDSTYILAATKDHWIKPSQYDWIEEILVSLRDLAINKKMWTLDRGDLTPKTIAVPKLGCGLGRLDWRIVKGMMVEHLTQVPTIFRIYE
jgi:O-acetyl-ADP-ribose deacetylase (regulator of RNase III)